MYKQVVTSFTGLAIGFLVGVSAVEIYHIETQSPVDRTCDSEGNVQALAMPPVAYERANAVEVLRVWIASDGPNQFVVEPFWEEPGTWGILLADIARHAANAHAQKHSGDPAEVLSKIEEQLLAELEHPTSAAQQIR